MPEIITAAEQGPGISPFVISSGRTFNYNYSVTGSAAAAGQAKQPPANLQTLNVNVVDNDGHDNTAFFNQMAAGDGIVANGQLWTISAVSVAAGIATFTVAPAASFPPFALVAFTFVPKGTIAKFPAFTPIVPPPVIGVGGGPPPVFPPPTPPPIGAIPPGILVGPAIAPAPVPPSVAGFPLIQFKTGSATAPTAASWFPEFTTTFPVPTIVVDGFMNSGTGQSGKSPPFINTPPAQTPSTLLIVIDGQAPQKPPWLPFMVEAHVAAGALERGVATGRGLTANELHEEEGPEPPPDEPEPRHPRHAPKRRRK